MPRRSKQNALDVWSEAKIIESSASLFWQRPFERYLQQEEINRGLGPWVDVEDGHLERFEPLLGHLIDFAPHSLSETRRGLEKWSGVREDLSEIENTYLVLKEALDFSLSLSERADRLLHLHTIGAAREPFLTDREYEMVWRVHRDADEFDLDPDSRNDVFLHLVGIERSIGMGEPYAQDDLKWLRAMRSLRGRGQPKLFALKYLVIALAELFETRNEFGESGGIGFDEVAGIRDESPFHSAFLEFFKDFVICSEAELHFRGANETSSNAREILRQWTKLWPSKKRPSLLGLKDLRTMAELLSCEL